MGTRVPEDKREGSGRNGICGPWMGASSNREPASRECPPKTPNDAESRDWNLVRAFRPFCVFRVFCGLDLPGFFVWSCPQNDTE